MSIEFKPTRSYIFTDLAKEEYRHKLLKWHMLHVEDSISQFRPYCMQYSFYPALPCPPDSEPFGVARSICASITGCVILQLKNSRTKHLPRLCQEKY